MAKNLVVPIPLLLIAFSATCHFPLLLNNGVYWDGWLLFGLNQNQNTQELIRLFTEASGPQVGYLHLLMQSFPNFIFGYKLVTFAAILIVAYALYEIGRLSGLLSELESFYLAALSTAFTAYQVHIELIMMTSYLSLAMFLVGVLIAQKYVIGKVRALMPRIISLLLLFLSFTINSLLVLYLVFLLSILMGSDLPVLSGRLKFILRRVAGYFDFFLLPALFWAMQMLVFTRGGMYQSYNEINIDISAGALLEGLATYLHSSILEQYSNAFGLIGSSLLHFFVFSLFSFAYFSLTVMFLEKTARHAHDEVSRDKCLMNGVAIPWRLVLLVGATFLASTLPYILVGKPPKSSGWESRHALLVGIPLALGVIASARLLTFARPPRRFIYAIAAASIIPFLLFTWSIYANWQVRYIKDLSTVINLKSLPPDIISKVNMFWVDDDSSRWGEGYHFYEYAGLFKLAWGEESRLGQPFVNGDLSQATETLANFVSKIPLDRYALKDLDVQALVDCRAILKIRFLHKESDDLRLLRRYYYRLWVAPEKINKLLAPLTSVSVSCISCATDRTAHVISDLIAIQSALHRYHEDNSRFPIGVFSKDPLSSPAIGGWIPGLAPTYLTEVPADPRMSTAKNRQYLYMSNGVDYKIISHAADDIDFVRTAYPQLIDPRRPGHAYGFWTNGYAHE